MISLTSEGIFIMKKSSTKKIIETILILLLVSLPIIIIYYLTEKEYNYIYLFCINLFLLGMLFIFYALKYYDNDDYDPDKWFGDLIGARNGISKTRKKIKSDLFDEYGIANKKKKKKKKKNKEGELVDYKQEFEPEMALYKNLLVDQNRFTESLQREYDAIKSVKSSARGVNKQLSDLIENINGARQLSMQLVEKNVNTKKMIAELGMKQKKEMGGVLDGDNLAEFGSSYLKNLLQERNAILSNETQNNITEYSEDDMYGELANLTILDDDGNETDSDADKYLQYENVQAQVYVEIDEDKDIQEYEFVVKDNESNVIDDYPLPIHSNITINRSTNIATDAYGNKYPIIWA